MNAIYYHNEVIKTKYAGEVDSFVTDLFFAFIFAAYTMFIREYGGGIFTSITGTIALLCLLRAVYLAFEWCADLVGKVTKNTAAMSAYIGASDASDKSGEDSKQPTLLRSGRKKKYTSRRFRMARI